MAHGDGRRSKKLRGRQRDAVEEIADALLDARERSGNPNSLTPAIDEEAMKKVEKEGLCNEASLDIFVQWYSFGGSEHGLTLTEILSMPTWLRRDFAYILGVMGRRRREREMLEDQIEEIRKAKRGSRRTRKGRR